MLIFVLKVLSILTIPSVLIIPFLPFKKADVCFVKYDYNKKVRYRNLSYVITTLIVSFLLLIFLADINKGLEWLIALPFIQKLLILIPGRLAYTLSIVKFILLNLITFVPFFILKPIVVKVSNIILGKPDDDSIDDPKKNKNRTALKSEKERTRRLKELQKHSDLYFQNDNVKDESRAVKVQAFYKNGGSDKNIKKKTAPPENFIEFLRFVYYKIVGVFYHESDEYHTVKYPALKFSKHLLCFLIITGILFIFLATLLLIPALFKINLDIIYKISTFITEQFYLYPMIGFIVLREIRAFLSGDPKDVPDQFTAPFISRHPEEELNYSELEEAVMENREQYFVKSFRKDSVDSSTYDISKAPDEVRMIKQFIQKAHNTVNNDFLCGLEYMFKNENVIFDTTLYSSLGIYIFCYMHAELSFGKRMLFICNDKYELRDAMNYVSEGLEITSSTSWRIKDSSDIKSGKHIDVLFLTIDELDDMSIFSSGKLFFDELTDVFIFDTEKMISLHKYLCLIVTKRLEKESASSKMGKPPLNYCFFAKGSVANIKNTVIQLFDLSKRGVNVINSFNSAYDAKVNIWKTGTDTTLYIDRSAQQLQLDVAIAQTARKFNIENVSLMTGNTVYDNQAYDGILLNRCSASDNDLEYIIVSDDNYNFPSTLYHYLRFAGKKETVLHIISKPYLLREYFLTNAEEYVNKYDLLGKSVNEYTKEDKTALIILIIDAVNGMPLNEFLERAEKLADYIELTPAAEKNEAVITEYVNKCLIKIFAESFNPKLLHYEISRKTNIDGSTDYYISIIDDNKLLSAYLSDTNPITVVFDNTVDYDKAEDNGILSVPKNLISRYYLPNQTIAYKSNGKVTNYTVKSIDIENGVLTLDNTSDSTGVPEDYVQIRKYTVNSAEKYKVVPLRYDVSDLGFDYVELDLFKADVSVDTEGYYNVSSILNTVSFRSDAASEYIDLNKDQKLKEYLRRQIKTNVLNVKLHSENECSAEQTAALAALISEMMKTMYPDSYKCIAVCPVIDPDDLSNISEFSKHVINLYPTLSGLEPEENTIEFAIIEDVDGGSGIAESFCLTNGISMLNLLSFTAEFLKWAEDDKNNKLEYMKFGCDELPDFLNVEALSERLKQFRRNIVHVKPIPMKNRTRCSFCYAKTDKNDLIEVSDKRYICKKCIETSVNTFEKLEKCAESVHNIILESTEADDTFKDIKIDVDFISTAELKKMYKNEKEVPIYYTNVSEQTIYVEYGLPEAVICGLIAQQTTFIWQMYNLQISSSPIYTGHCEYVEIDVAERLNYTDFAKELFEIYSQNEGYKLIYNELNKIHSKDSFKFMVGYSSGSDKDTGNEEDDNTGGAINRNPSKTVYYHYEMLDDDEKQFYNSIVKAAQELSSEMVNASCQLTDDQISKVYKAIINDHPEIFWIDSYMVSDYGVKLIFNMNEGEVKKRQQKIQNAAANILKNVSPLISDYDAVLYIHDKIVSLLDYDSLKLKEEKLSPKLFNKHYVDDIRSVYGALVNKKAVCAGYAKAMQYLLNKIGIECTYVIGQCHDGEYHAWNLVKLNNEYYYIDVTWDDHSDTNPKEHSDFTHHDYFCVTTKEIELSRNIMYNEYFSYPECTAVKYNYYVKEKLYFENYSYIKIKNGIIRQLKKGAKIISLKFQNKNEADYAYQKLVKDREIHNIINEYNPKIKPNAYSGANRLNIIRIYF